ncbi:hypothetical protein MFIFM68171_08157 [Madurella fahalii]|uniref:NACHT domain-containing protein n=1 Tax=Madurella fahalii TaxID=1157608 RepID=A0ABQ0GJK6_9PEZI
MDPASVIGLGASIIQLIETTVKIIGYANAVKSAPAERAQFARHASSLLALLTDLRAWGKGGPLDQLHDQMERLTMKLAPPSGPLKKMGRALIWAIDKKEIEEALTQIERVEALVSLAFQNDQFRLTLAVKRDLQDLQGVISDAVVKRKDKGFRAVTDWLSGIDFAAKHADFLHRRRAGTGEWLLSDPTFQYWLSGENRLLWCSGLPGAGKTTLSAMVIDWLASGYPDQQVAIIYFYCSYKERELHTAKNVIGSLLKQLIQHMPSLPEGLLNLYDEHRQKGTRPDLNELTRLITQHAQNFSDIFVVIDALDEYSDFDLRRSTLFDEIEKLPENVRILITSRHSQRIDERFKGVPYIEVRAADEDVKRYVVARYDKEMSLAGRIRSNQALKEEIIDTVVARSQGMFLLSQLHMDSLSKKLTVRQVRSALASLPNELDDTYNQVMGRIQEQDDTRATLAHRILYWISRATRISTRTVFSTQSNWYWHVPA